MKKQHILFVISLLLITTFSFGCSSSNQLERYLNQVDDWESSYMIEIETVIKKYPAVYDVDLPISQRGLRNQYQGYWTEALPITKKYEKEFLKLDPPEEATTFHNSMKYYLETAQTVFSDGKEGIINQNNEQLTRVLVQMQGLDYEQKRLVDLRHSLWERALND